jgi:hypothetical protein
MVPMFLSLKTDKKVIVRTQSFEINKLVSQLEADPET